MPGKGTVVPNSHIHGSGAEPALRVQALRDVAEVIKGLPAEAERQLMIPLGSHAFIPGRVKHTNEFYVKLDEHFVKMSALRARQSIARRVKRLEVEHGLPMTSSVPKQDLGGSKNNSTSDLDDSDGDGPRPRSPHAQARDSGIVEQELAPPHQGHGGHQATEDTVRSEVHHNPDGTVTILEFHDETTHGKPTEAAPARPAPPPTGVEVVQSSRAKGNEAFRDKLFDLAATHYSTGINAIRDALRQHCSGTAGYGDIDATQLHVLLTNRAAAYVALENYSGAIRDATDAISSKPEYVLVAHATVYIIPVLMHVCCCVGLLARYSKAYHRLAQAQIGQKRFADAVTTYEKAIGVDPENKFLQKQLRSTLKLETVEAKEPATGSATKQATPMTDSPITESSSLAAAQKPAPQVKKKRSLFARRLHGM